MMGLAGVGDDDRIKSQSGVVNQRTGTSRGKYFGKQDNTGLASVSGQQPATPTEGELNKDGESMGAAARRLKAVKPMPKIITPKGRIPTSIKEQ